MSKRFFSNPGSKFRPVKEPFYDDRGALSLRVVGKDNIDALIQSHAAECDINCIIKRFELGDPGALSRGQMFFGDLVGMPGSISEFLNLQARVEETFFNLPVSVRNKFDNDPKKFLASYGNDDFIAAVRRDPADRASDLGSNAEKKVPEKKEAET